MDKGAAIKINLDQLLARVRDAQFKHLTKNPFPMQHILESERDNQEQEASAIQYNCPYNLMMYTNIRCPVQKLHL